MTKESSLGAPALQDRDAPRPGGAAERNQKIEEELDSLRNRFLVSPEAEEVDEEIENTPPSPEAETDATTVPARAEGSGMSLGDASSEFLKEWEKAKQEAVTLAPEASIGEQSPPGEEKTEVTETNAQDVPHEEVPAETEQTTPPQRPAQPAATVQRPVPGMDGVLVTPRQVERRRERDFARAGSTETKYDVMTYEELAGDPYAGPMLERRVLDFLASDPGWNGNEYAAELTPDGYLVRADGTKSDKKPSMLVHGGNAISRLARMVKDDMRTTERQMPVPESMRPEGNAPTQEVADTEQAEEKDTRAEPADKTQEPPAGPDAAGGTPKPPEGGAREKDAQAWNEARAQYIRYRRELMTARQEWEAAIEAHNEFRKSKGISFFFDKKEVTDRVAQAEATYDAVLQKFRNERASFAERFATYAGGSEKTKERIAEYTALREVILDRRIDQDVEVVERMRMFGGQRESTNRFWEATKRFGKWYGAQPLGKKVLFGAGAGAVVGGVVAVGSAATAGMVFGTAAASAARRAVGTLTGAKVGALMGGVKSTIDSVADRYQERTIKKLKDAFGEQDLSDARKRRVATRRTARIIKHAGTATAVGVTAGAAYVAGSSVAEALSNPEATVTSVQEAASQAVPEVAQEVAEPAPASTETVQENLSPTTGKPVTEVSPEDATSPMEAEAYTTEQVDPNNTAPEEADTSPTQEVYEAEEPATQEAPAAGQKSPDDFTEPYVPPTEPEVSPITAADTPPEAQTEQVFPRNGVPETNTEGWDTETYLREAWQSMQDSAAEVPNSPMPDDVPAHMEDINLSPEEPTPIYTVEKGDTVWKMLEKNLEARGSFTGLNEAQRITLIDDIKDEITKLSPSELREMGIESGKADLIRAGEKIDLSNVLNEETIEKAITDAKSISETRAGTIVEQQGRPGVSSRDVGVNFSKAELSGAYPEPTNPAPFTSVSSQAPPPFTSISSMEVPGEQAAVGTEVRPSDFPRTQAYFEHAMKADGVRALNADASRSVVRHLFNEQRIFSRMIEGNQKMFDANWNAISTLTMNDVFNGDGKLILDGGRIATPLSGAEAERVVRTMVTQAVEGIEAQGTANTHALFEQAQRENWSLGTFFDRLGTELEAHAAANDATPAATLASLDASEVVAETQNVSGVDGGVAEQVVSDVSELSPAEQQHALDTLKQIAKAHAPEDRPLSPAQKVLLTKRAVEVFVNQYAHEEGIPVPDALERLNSVTGTYADTYLGDADGVMEAEEGNLLREFSQKNEGFKALQRILTDQDSLLHEAPKPTATLAALDPSEAVAQGDAGVSSATESANVAPENTTEGTAAEALSPEKQRAFETFDKIAGVRVPEDSPLNGTQERYLMERAVKAYVDQYAAQEGINTKSALERLNEMTGEYADKNLGDADGVVEADEGKALQTFTRKNPGFKILQKMMDEQERPRRTEPLVDARFPIGSKDGLFGGKVEVGGEAGIRIGGHERVRYVDVRMNDPISPTANSFVEKTYLRAHPEWNTATAEELIESDPAFEKAWRSYVGGEDDNGETLNNRWGRITQEGKGRTPGYRSAVDPRDIEQLKQMKGSDALKQLQDQLEEYKEKNVRRVPRRDIHIRVKPFKD